jgi:putative flippase GtrA
MIVNSQFLRYALSGLIINALGLISYIIFLKYLNFSPFMAISIQYPIIFCIYYLMQTYFVFNKKINAKNLAQLLLNLIFLYFLNIVALFSCIKILNLNAILSQCLIMVILVSINFSVQKKIIYS